MSLSSLAMLDFSCINEGWESRLLIWMVWFYDSRLNVRKLGWLNAVWAIIVNKLAQWGPTVLLKNNTIALTHSIHCLPHMLWFSGFGPLFLVWGGVVLYTSFLESDQRQCESYLWIYNKTGHAHLLGAILLLSTLGLCLWAMRLIDWLCYLWENLGWRSAKNIVAGSHGILWDYYHFFSCSVMYLTSVMYLPVDIRQWLSIEHIIHLHLCYLEDALVQSDWQNAS